MNIIKESARFDKKFVCVQFPGLVNDEKKAIECLGGAQGMAEVHSAKSRLQLRFRKEDPYCKPAYSNTASCYGILLKVRVKKNKKNATKPPQILNTEVMGIVDTMYKFETLADFQYLPVFDNPKNEFGFNIEKNILNILQPKGIVDNQWLNTEQDYFLVPSIFSRIDCPQSYFYRANVKKQDIDTRQNLIGAIRKGRPSGTVFISFSHTDETPTIPSKKGQEKLSSVSKSDLEIVTKLYEKRPIWSKTALLNESKLTYPVLKKILLNVAYYYMNGPWRRLWIKLGYDPRKDPQSRIYQNIDFRFRNTGGFKSALKDNEIKKFLLNDKSQKIDDMSTDSFENNTTKSNTDSDYVFRPGMVPLKKQVFYQYCDLKVPEVEEMLSKLGEVLPGSLCNERRGWMPNGFDEQCRDIINGYIIDKMREIMALNRKLISNDNSSVNIGSLDEAFDYDEDDDDDDDNDDEDNDEVDSECEDDGDKIDPD